MQFYPKVLPSFTIAIIELKWVKPGKKFYPPNPDTEGGGDDGVIQMAVGMMV